MSDYGKIYFGPKCILCVCGHIVVSVVKFWVGDFNCDLDCFTFLTIK